ncbi:MAG: restriction endonuclease subunit S [Anaerolineae bacterium]|nr:restriction endonuclease subunit S [Anaerolineae bacterium]
MKPGWETKKFGDVCGFVRGPFGGSLKKQIFVKDGYAVYEQQHAIYDQFDDIRYFVNENKFNEMKRFEVNSGNLIMSCSGTMGKVAIVPKGIKKGIINQALLLLKPSKHILNTFIKLWMESEGFQDSLKAYSQGAAIQNVASVKILKEIDVPVPPIPEQERIVSVLDEAFASIAQAKSNAKQKLVNARELFEAYLESLFANPHKGWEKKILAEIIDSNVIGLVKNSSEQGAYKEYKYVKMNNITPKNNFDFSKYTCVDATKDEVEKYSLANSDFLFNTRNSKELVGKTCVYSNTEDGPVLFNNNIMRIRFAKTINSCFLNYQFTTKLLQEKLNLMKSGTTNVSAIYYKNLQYLPLLIPPLAEQCTIVGRLEALSAETGRLEAVYRQKVAGLDELKKSVLAKAFEGSL